MPRRVPKELLLKVLGAEREAERTLEAQEEPEAEMELVCSKDARPEADME